MCQILTDIEVEEKTPFTLSVSGANGVTITPYQLVVRNVPRNSGPQGKPNATLDYDLVKDFLCDNVKVNIIEKTYVSISEKLAKN